ncbi:hypothetical protein [Blastopirellula marina]|uniref:Oligosaccharide repeat unit polymerase n=1 Tax=Blastopirellula marina TaxID=124 RepID=A0A2S8G180_9BACT|nr:hypothetical protein [Blastopirellula marina]PQO38070.1 hypothetical protein C5Y98_08275 [Blastopirellula marina]PTL44726.1 hypothetical protein C5Y97_08275 [Blastopirellula marina]
MILLLGMTGAAIIWSMSVAYQRTRDPLHPLVYIGPMLIYMFVYLPVKEVFNGGFDRWFPDAGLLLSIQVCFTLGIVLFCVGVLHGTGPVKAGAQRVVFRAPEVVCERLYQTGCILGMLAVVAYLYAIMRSGGFLKVYGGAKGHYSAGTGYINEMVNFAIPAVALVLLSWQGKVKNKSRILLAIFFSSPLLVHGLLGARRGPTFIILATIFVSWFIASGKKISVAKVVASFGVIGVLILFLFANRGNIHLGSDVNIEWTLTRDYVTDDVPDDAVFMYAVPAMAQATGTHYWGIRYAATYLIRPIPRQIWPNKYHDLGLDKLFYQDDVAGIPDSEWIAILGWRPLRGSAGGFICDFFLEFSWGALLFCYLLGRFYGELWRRAATLGGLWTLLYIMAAGLSVYIPTQSVSAVFHRFLFMAIPTILLWKMISPSGKLSVPMQAKRKSSPEAFPPSRS